MSTNVVTAHERFAHDIGKDYAATTDVVQASLLKGFVAGLLLECGSRADAERQLAYVAHNLTTEEKELLNMLGSHDD